MTVKLEGQTAEEADLYEMDRLPNDELKKLSSVQFIAEILDEFGPVSDNEETRP